MNARVSGGPSTAVHDGYGNRRMYQRPFATWSTSRENQWPSSRPWRAVHDRSLRSRLSTGSLSPHFCVALLVRQRHLVDRARPQACHHGGVDVESVPPSLSDADSCRQIPFAQPIALRPDQTIANRWRRTRGLTNPAVRTGRFSGAGLSAPASRLLQPHVAWFRSKARFDGALHAQAASPCCSRAG